MPMARAALLSFLSPTALLFLQLQLTLPTASFHLSTLSCRGCFALSLPCFIDCIHFIHELFYACV